MGRKKTKVAPADSEPTSEAPTETPPADEAPATNEETKEAAVTDVTNVTANGEESKDDKTESKETAGEKKKKKKPVKKTVPDWASLSDAARRSLPKSQMAKPKVQDSIIAAIQACGDSKGET